MALSMDEERMLAEIERRLADDDPVLAMRLTSFRLPRLSLAPRSPRARLTASLLMLLVVAAVSVFVYALMPFRGQNGGNVATHGSAPPSHPTLSASGKSVPSASFRSAGRSSQAPGTGQGTPRPSGSSASDGGK
jgi:Protein of unknown function (DUF3040)